MKKILIRASMVKNTFTECLLAVLWIFGIKFHRGQFQPRQPFPPQPPISNDFVESGCEQFSTKKLALIIAMLIGLCLPAGAQTNTPPLSFPPISLDFFTNLPPAPDFNQAVAGVAIGVLTKSGGMENAIDFNYNIRTNWMVSIEVQNTLNQIDALGVAAGYRLAWTSAEAYAQLGARRTWNTDVTGHGPRWQGLGLLGASWLPHTGGSFLVGVEGRLLTSPTGAALNSKPGGEFFAFAKYNFGKGK